MNSGAFALPGQVLTQAIALPKGPSAIKHEELSTGGEHYENSDDPDKVHLKMPQKMQHELISIPVTKPNGKASTVFWWN